MDRRQTLPRLWLMTDERQGNELWKALERLPRGSGVVFRHYTLPREERRAWFEKVKVIGRRHGLLVLLAGSPSLARAWKAPGSHGRSVRRSPALVLSAPVHSLREIRAAERARADILFLSPVFATRSHPGARTLGRARFALLARQTRLPVIALGGLNKQCARTLTGSYGWAAIDALSG
jgi:thiamine-phosphate pyrophosphorylase